MKLPAFVRGAVFDLDGTLLDSLGAWSRVDARFFARRALPLPPDYMEAVKTFGLRSAAEYTKARFALPDPPEEIVREWQTLIREEYARNVPPKPFAAELLRTLHGAGVKLAIATSSEPALFLPALERFEIDTLFSAIVDTHAVGKDKDFPDVYLEAARQIGVPPKNCAVFEDIPEGLLSAKAGGFFTVGVYDVHGEKNAPRMREIADMYLRSFEELL